MHSLLLENIAKHVTLTEEEQYSVIENFDIEDVRKKACINDITKPMTKVAFVNFGCLRSFVIDSNGVEHNLQFAPREWWMTDMKSLLYHHNSELIIESVESSQILTIERKNQLLLMESIPKINHFFRILTERALAEFQQRVIQNLSVPAIGRYELFCTKYPDLILTLPQKQIASYLGITPEFFSTMRSNYLRKKH